MPINWRAWAVAVLVASSKERVDCDPLTTHTRPRIESSAPSEHVDRCGEAPAVERHVRLGPAPRKHLTLPDLSAVTNRFPCRKTADKIEHNQSHNQRKLWQGCTVVEVEGWRSDVSVAAHLPRVANPCPQGILCWDPGKQAQPSLQHK